MIITVVVFCGFVEVLTDCAEQPFEVLVLTDEVMIFELFYIVFSSAKSLNNKQVSAVLIIMIRISRIEESSAY